MSTTIVSPKGEVALPKDLLLRHGLAGNSRVRIVETRSGILLMPLTDGPIDPRLARELAEWQSLGQSAWDRFPYEAEAE